MNLTEANAFAGGADSRIDRSKGLDLERREVERTFESNC